MPHILPLPHTVPHSGPSLQGENGSLYWAVADGPMVSD